MAETIDAPDTAGGDGRGYAPYDPHAVEARWYAYWMANGYFKPRIRPGRAPFTIIMPPPNVTGALHLGHALTASVEDTLVRWHRMLGDPTLWLPGRDHAGIAAQVVVERLLAKEGKTRHQIGREAFLERMWAWMNEYGGVIRDQHRRLGASADWDREKFTMDPGPARAVRTAFTRLYDEGLIYRGKRITNWCPRCMTALSDLEVVHEEEQGKLWYVRYPLAPGPAGEREYLTVATTRPETILGDTGIAVHPEDPRYRHLIGREATVPAIGRRIPVIADEAVDPAFGTGAVKVTPGHDPTDFEIGARHRLGTVLVMNLDGTMSEQAGPYAGLTREEARRRLVAQLEAEGLLERVERHIHAVGHCDRCKTVVEPIVTEQWYVRIAPLAERALAAVRDGRIQIIPERFVKVYFNWMENIRDWCISRQLWWGHRIPVYTCPNGHEFASVEEPRACRVCGAAELTQDPDVLDTWFSSGLWPFSTLGWPDDTEDLRYFYPTSVMETGYDILFFWVARMIMLGLHFMGDVPFRQVYLHGLIRVGREKMSKVKGNVLDPLDLIDKYGADALRLALLTGTTPGNDTQINEAKLDSSRDFVNKLWNAARFVMLNLPPDLRPAPGVEITPPLDGTAADRWIVARLAAAIREVTRLLQDFQLGEAARTAREFVWGELCDWYLEIAKVQFRELGKAGQRRTAAVLAGVLENTLRLLHPFAPFVTEEIWQRLVYPEGPRGGPDGSIMVAPWPVAPAGAEAAGDELAPVMALVNAVRNLRSEYRVDWKRWVPATVIAGERTGTLEQQAAVLATLGRLRPITILADGERPRRAIPVIAGGVELYLPVEGMFDVAQETARLERELADATAEVDRAEAVLARPGFVEKAPAEVVARERERLAAAQERVAKIQASLRTLREE